MTSDNQPRDENKSAENRSFFQRIYFILCGLGIFGILVLLIYIAFFKPNPQYINNKLIPLEKQQEVEEFIDKRVNETFGRTKDILDLLIATLAALTTVMTLVPIALGILAVLARQSVIQSFIKDIKQNLDEQTTKQLKTAAVLEERLKNNQYELIQAIENSKNLTKEIEESKFNLYVTQAKDAFNKGDFIKAKESYELAKNLLENLKKYNDNLNWKPYESEILWSKAQTLMRLKETKEKHQQNLTDAEKIYNELLAKDPSYTNAYYGMGLIEAERENFENAIDNYKKVTETQQAYAWALFNWGKSLTILGFVANKETQTLAKQRVFQFCTLAIQKSSEILAISLFLVMILRKEEGIVRHEEALNKYEEALKPEFESKLYPSKPDVLYFQGLSLIELERYSNAIESIKLATLVYQRQFSTEPPWYHYDLSRAYALNHQPENAINNLRIAINLPNPNPDDPNTNYRTRAVAESAFKLLKNEEFKEQFNQLINTT